MRRVIGLVLAAVVLAGSAARAGEAERYQLAEKLLVAMEVQKTIEQSFATVREMQMTQLRNMNLGEKGSEQAQAMQGQIMDMISKELSWDSLKKDYAQIYAETFTEDELKGLVAFYESPVGRSFVEKQPELIRKSMMLTQKQMYTIMPRIEQMTRQAAQQLQQSAPAATGVPTLTPRPARPPAAP